MDKALQLHGYMGFGKTKNTFDNKTIKTITDYCPFCNSHGILRKKQTHVNGWSYACKKCFDFFGNPIFRKVTKKQMSKAIEHNEFPDFGFFNGLHYGYPLCCIMWFIGNCKVNGIGYKIPEYASCKIEIMIDGIIYSSQMYDLGFIDQQLQVLVKILEAIKHE